MDLQRSRNGHEEVVVEMRGASDAPKRGANADKPHQWQVGAGQSDAPVELKE